MRKRNLPISTSLKKKKKFSSLKKSVENFESSTYLECTSPLQPRRRRSESSDAVRRESRRPVSSILARTWKKNPRWAAGRLLVPENRQQCERTSRGTARDSRRRNNNLLLRSPWTGGESGGQNCTETECGRESEGIVTDAVARRDWRPENWCTNENNWAQVGEQERYHLRSTSRSRLRRLLPRVGSLVNGTSVRFEVTTHLSGPPGTGHDESYVFM